MIKIAILLLLIFSPTLYAGESLHDACDEYHKKMKSIPHINIRYEKEKIFTYVDNKTYTGCLVTVYTKWSLVGQDFNQYSILDLPGWKNGDFHADGAGSGVHNRIRGNLFCMVGYSFMAYADEETQSIVTGDDLDLYAKCGMK